MIKGHGGNVVSLAHELGCPVDDIIDMSCNLNPLGPPEHVETFLKNNITKIRSLPQADARQMVDAFCRYYATDPSRVLAGNGTTWFLYTLPAALKSQRLLIAGPTYSDYADGCAMHGVDFSYYMASEDEGFYQDLSGISALLSDKNQDFDTVVLCNPNNPTGVKVQKKDLLDLVAGHRDVTFIIDESYLPFVDNAETISLVSEDRFDNLAVLSSMSKIFRIPGLRTGFLSAHPTVIEKVKKYYQPWSVNALAQAAVVHIFENSQFIRPFIEETRRFIKTEKKIFYEMLEPIEGIELFASETYFILARLTCEMTSDRFCHAIGRGKILIRDCSNFAGLSDRFVRFSLSTRDLNTKLATLICQSLKKPTYA